MGCFWSENTKQKESQDNSKQRKKEQQQLPQNPLYKNQDANWFAGATNQCRKQQMSLTGKLQSILFRPFKKSDKKSIEQILILSGQWKLNSQNESALFKDSSYLFKQKHLYKCFLLTARVLKNIKFLFQTLSKEIPLFLKQAENIDLIQKYIIENKLQVVGSRLLFTESPRPSELKQALSSYMIEKQHSNKEIQKLERFYNFCKENKSQYFTNLLQLLSEINIIQLEEIKPLFRNEFMDKVENIQGSQKKEMIIDNYCFHQLQKLSSFQTSKTTQTFEQFERQQEVLPNYMFYCGKRIIRSDMDIQKLHGKYHDYQFLQDVHDYIQWMFPNHYGSNFNSESFPLNYLQSQLFLSDIKVAEKMFKSIMIFLDFMGITIDQKYQLAICSQQRLKNAILVYSHNHLRIMRLLACLSVTGFRQIAEKLVDFLDQHTEEGNILSEQRNQFQKSWKLYGRSEIQSAKLMCFLENNQFPATFDFWKNSNYLKRIQIHQKVDNNGSGIIKNKERKKYVNIAK